MTKIIAAGFLLLTLALIALTLRRSNANAASKFSLDDLLLGDDGKASKAAAWAHGAFFFTTWMMIFLTLREKMSEGYLAIYVAAWITPTVTRLVKNPAAPPSP